MNQLSFPLVYKAIKSEFEVDIAEFVEAHGPTSDDSRTHTLELVAPDGLTSVCKASFYADPHELHDIMCVVRSAILANYDKQLLGTLMRIIDLDSDALTGINAVIDKLMDMEHREDKYEGN